MNKNYQLIKEEYLNDIKCTLSYYKHIKSGARILLIPCEDNNKTFAIGFRTPPKDDTGVPHILEHSTLCGSRKFPVKDPFVELLKSSLNTYLNAVTYPDKTFYPVASCNDKDFKNLMDVYMDAVLYPNVYNNELIFKQEGWHYELDDINSDITINGVVYNEMKGAFSDPEQVLSRLSMHATYPDTTYGVESGGDPCKIPNLTYKDFVNFHHTYYSPSNSYIILYGNCDMNERLDWLDKEYLSKFNIIDVKSEIEYQQPFNKEKIIEQYYPISESSNIENKTYYSFNTIIGDYSDLKLNLAFRTIGYSLIEAQGAPLKQALLDSGLCLDVDGFFEDELIQPCFNITVKNAKENSIELFKKVINDTLLDIVNKGLDKNVLKGSINRALFIYREANFGSTPTGLVYTFAAMRSWLYDDDNPWSGLDIDKIYLELLDEIDTNYYEELIKKYLINNNHKAYVILKPSKTILKEEETALKDKLNDYKNSLSNEELIKLINETNLLKKYQDSPSSKEDIDKLPRLLIEDIKEEKCIVYNNEHIIDDVKVISHDIDTRGISYLKLYFDITNISFEELKYICVLDSLLGYLDTKSYNYKDLDVLSNINLGGLSFYPVTYLLKNGGFKAYFVIKSKALYKKEQYIFEYINEIINSTKFENKSRIKELIQEDVTSLESSLQSSGHKTAINRAFSYTDIDSKYNELFQGIDAYDLLKDLLDNYDDKIDYVLDICKRILKHICSKNNLIVSYTGLNKDIYPMLEDYISKLDNYFYDEKSKFSFNKNILNEGLKTTGKVQYVARIGHFDPSKFNGAFLTFLMALKFDYLWTKIRVLGGAYGAMSNILSSGSIYFVSFRDPKLKETNKIFEEVVKYVDFFEPKKEELTNYIIGAIGSYDSVKNPESLGSFSMSLYITGKSPEDYDKTRNEIINTKISDIKKIKEIYINALKENIICVVGNETIIEDNKDMFKNIRSLLK